MNGGKERWREDKKKKSREEGGEGEEGVKPRTAKQEKCDAADGNIRGGLKHSPRTASSWGEPNATDWSIRGNGAPGAGASEGKKRQADTSVEPGLEIPGKQRIRTGTSGGQKPWTGTSREGASLDWNVRGCRRRRKRRRRETAKRT